MRLGESFQLNELRPSHVTGLRFDRMNRAPMLDEKVDLFAILGSKVRDIDLQRAMMEESKYLSEQMRLVCRSPHRPQL